MRELGYVLAGCAFFIAFFVGVIYPDIEHKGHPAIGSCTGECYRQYVADNGTVEEQIQEKKEIAIAKAESGIVDEFETIRGIWPGCSACHGQDGSGGIGPKLAGQTADYISGRLISYKNKERIGSQSAMMWGQAGLLSESDIQLIGQFIEEGFPKE
jgi:cytochrome c553|tara:strand:+ start:1625 stop:2092 length:468 start_codon:yes stop_codon:yes gene_type:complete